MPNRKDFRVVPGGLAGRAKREDLPPEQEISELLGRVAKYRGALAAGPGSEIDSLICDMEDAIAALQRLERSAKPEAADRAAEYRRLIAELDAEIAASKAPGQS